MIEQTPKSLSLISSQIANGLSLKDRFFMKYRPRICPFHKLMQFVPQSSRVFDIGCGNGLWLHLLMKSDRISSGLGVEVSEKAVTIANSLKANDENLDFVYRTPLQGWPEVDCDCLTMIDVLHHVPPSKQKEFILQIKDTNAKVVVFKDIDPASKIKAGMNSLHDMVVSQQLPKYRKSDDVVSWLEEAGFKIEDRGRADMLWYSHYYIVAKR